MSKGYHVSIGKLCIQCGEDDWVVKRAFKLCQCGMKCWIVRYSDAAGTHYRYHQSEMAPENAVVIGMTKDNPYSGKHRSQASMGQERHFKVGIKT